MRVTYETNDIVSPFIAAISYVRCNYLAIEPFNWHMAKARPCVPDGKAGRRSDDSQRIIYEEFDNGPAKPLTTSKREYVEQPDNGVVKKVEKVTPYAY